MKTAKRIAKGVGVPVLIVVAVAAIIALIWYSDGENITAETVLSGDILVQKVSLNIQVDDIQISLTDQACSAGEHIMYEVRFSDASDSLEYLSCDGVRSFRRDGYYAEKDITVKRYVMDSEEFHKHRELSWD